MKRPEPNKKRIVAVIDAGGRGSVLIDKYAQSPEVDELIAIPGNDLMQINTSKPVYTFPNLKTTSKQEILEICHKFNVSLVDVAQDNAIETGVSDLLRQNGFNVFGASRDAGRLEWDKAYSREFMVKYNLPVPAYQVCHSEKEGIAFVESQDDQSWFIKASGLAEGKGVIPAKNRQEAVEAIKQMARFGTAGATFLVEQALVGEEFSSFAISDGLTYQILGSAQDHKRVDDGDVGPNTGGMGCSTPPLVVNSKVQNQINQIFSKTFEGLKKERIPYVGMLYLGGILVDGEVYIIEYNSRWGDPEVECILPGIKNDWFEVVKLTVEQRLNSVKITSDSKSRVVVACSSKGYPGDYSHVKGCEISGLDRVIAENSVKVYGAGVKKEDNKFIASGGRLFYIVSEGKNVIKAREKVYQAIKLVSIQDKNGEDLMHYRTDIGIRDVNRLKSNS